ncbi:anti-sigma factor [Pedobacter yulinensis]|uniref:Anti-sigma factor n=1 Tax=Pedobacter yulinensis TaxID=2126353 RepID=A0A2T3HMJ7_9SPHI|nr:FecR family protein [Pedobacter yulinensis]PST83665.1 anti-sigma factor [Pedobacter yulinensis]
MMNKQEAQKLLEKYLNGTITPQEKVLFEQLSNRVTKKRLDRSPDTELHDIGEQIYAKLPQPAQRPRTNSYRFIAVAAMVILCVSVSLLVFTKNKNKPEQVAHLAPGSNTATLTLANGKKILLSNATAASLSEQAGISISKTRKGELVYTVGQSTNLPVEYNITETPRGGQYRIVLPDGTKVWLNASSSLRYPTRFTGATRGVELKGEAYFQVAHNAAMPFKVKTDKQVVTVLGTHFNINAYPDEPVLKTTLLEGKVKIDAIGKASSGILKPGQQAALTGAGLTITEGDTEQAVAWKNGYFRFRGERIENVMRKLSRWYNIDVKYDTTSGEEGYYGTISRFKNLSQVLAVLAETGSVHFKIEGRRVTVMK